MNTSLRNPVSLLAVLVVVVATAAFGSLAVASGHAQPNGTGAAIPPFTVVFSHNTTALSQLTIGSKVGMDVSWKAGTCSNGFDSPPVAFTWAGPTVPQTAAPVMAPCRKATKMVADTVICGTIHIPFTSKDIFYYWNTDTGETHGAFTTSAAASVKGSCPIDNPLGAANANVFLYKGSFTKAVLMTPTGAPVKAITVPAGTNAIHWYGIQGGS